MKEITVAINIKNKKINKSFNNYIDLLTYLFINDGYIKDKSIIHHISSTLDYFPMYRISNNTIHLLTDKQYIKKAILMDYRPINSSNIEIINKINKKKIFLKNYDLILLEKTYYDYFKDDPELNEITYCLKPDFIFNSYQIKPYYTINELSTILYLNRNIGRSITEKNVSKCIIVNDLTINNNMLNIHNDYISWMNDANKLDNILKYYSLFGGGYWNVYLRNPLHYRITEIMLDNIISLIKIIDNSPSFDKSYYLYRFVSEDLHLMDLKIGDIFTDDGFTSTSREVYFEKDINYGKIFIKIKIPADTKGCGLMIQSSSIFEYEKEILIRPSNYKLISKNMDPSIGRKTYEFEWMSINTNGIKNIIDKKLFIEKKNINNVKILDIKTENLDDFSPENKAKIFFNKYKPEFKTKIGNKFVNFKINTVTSEVYKRMFTFTNPIIIYAIDEYMCTIDIMIEIKNNKIAVNDAFKYNYIEKNSKYSVEELMLFYKDLGRLFNAEIIIIYPDYSLYNNIEISQTLLYLMNIYKKDDVNISDKTKYLLKHYKNSLKLETLYFLIDISVKDLIKILFKFIDGANDFIPDYNHILIYNNLKDYYIKHKKSRLIGYLYYIITKKSQLFNIFRKTLYKYFKIDIDEYIFELHLDNIKTTSFNSELPVFEPYNGNRLSHEFTTRYYQVKPTKYWK